jgi:hypothetical protein
VNFPLQYRMLPKSLRMPLPSPEQQIEPSSNGLLARVTLVAVGEIGQRDDAGSALFMYSPSLDNRSSHGQDPGPAGRLTHPRTSRNRLEAAGTRAAQGATAVPGADIAAQHGLTIRRTGMGIAVGVGMSPVLLAAPLHSLEVP